MSALGVPRKTGLVVSFRDHRADHDGSPFPEPELAVCARCLRHKIASPDPLCRSCSAVEAERFAAEIEVSGEVCACGCGRRFARDGVRAKRFASLECKARDEAQRRRAARGVSA